MLVLVLIFLVFSLFLFFLFPHRAQRPAPRYLLSPSSRGNSGLRAPLVTRCARESAGGDDRARFTLLLFVPLSASGPALAFICKGSTAEVLDDLRKPIEAMEARKLPHSLEILLHMSGEADFVRGGACLPSCRLVFFSFFQTSSQATLPMSCPRPAARLSESPARRPGACRRTRACRCTDSRGPCGAWGPGGT